MSARTLSREQVNTICSAMLSFLVTCNVLESLKRYKFCTFMLCGELRSQTFTVKVTLKRLKVLMKKEWNFLFLQQTSVGKLSHFLFFALIFSTFFNFFSLESADFCIFLLFLFGAFFAYANCVVFQTIFERFSENENEENECARRCQLEIRVWTMKTTSIFFSFCTFTHRCP